MIKVVAKAKEASLKKRRFNIIDEDREKVRGVEERQSMFGFKGKEIVGSSRGS